MSESFTLSIVTYPRGRDHRTGALKPYHWTFMIETGGPGTGAGIAHQLSGMPGGFSYPEASDIEVNNTSEFKEKLDIGAIPADKLDEVREILSQISIDNDETTDWNCQSWCREGFVLFERQGWITPGLTVDGVSHWLREEQWKC